jgi:hypothetical protein
MGYFIITVFGFVCGYIIGRALLMRDVDEAEADAEKELKPKKPDKIIAYMKESDGIYYIYNTEDDMFLAQGKTSAEISERLHVRFPGVRIFLKDVR